MALKFGDKGEIMKFSMRSNILLEMWRQLASPNYQTETATLCSKTIALCKVWCTCKHVHTRTLTWPEPK